MEDEELRGEFDVGAFLKMSVEQVRQMKEAEYLGWHAYLALK